MMKRTLSKSLFDNLILLMVLTLLMPILIASCSNNQSRKGSDVPKTAEAENSIASENGNFTTKTTETKNITLGEKSPANDKLDSPQATAEAYVSALVSKNRSRSQQIFSEQLLGVDTLISRDEKTLSNVDPSFLKYNWKSSTQKGYYNVTITYKTKDLIDISIYEKNNKYFVNMTNNSLGLPGNSSTTPPSTMPDKISASSPNEERIKQDLIGEAFFYKVGSVWTIEKTEISEFKIVNRDNNDPDYEFIIADITLSSNKSTIKGLLKITYTKSEKGWLFSRIQRMQDFNNPVNEKTELKSNEQYIERTISQKDGNIFMLEVHKGQQVKMVSNGNFRLWLGGDKYSKLFSPGTQIITADAEGGWYINVPEGTVEIKIYLE